MIYLHKSVFQSHGYLSSAKCHVDSRSIQSHGYLSTANCHVDSRWVLKISGFALHAFRNDDHREQVINKLILQLMYRHAPFTNTCACTYN